MCVGCREMKEKRELLRVVHTPDGAVFLDRTGKANGRGAYVCKSAQCLQKAVKTASTSSDPVLYIQGVWPTGKKAYFAVPLQKD